MEARPTAIILGNANILGISLARELLDKSCKVVVCSYETSSWQNQFPNLLVQSPGATLPDNASYGFIITSPTNDSKFTPQVLDKFFEYFISKNTKTAVVLPFLITSSNREEAGIVVTAINKFKSPLFKIFYIGEVVGPGMERGDGYVTGALLASARQKTLRIPEYDFEIFPVYIAIAVREIIKNIFSFGNLNKQTVLAQRTTVTNFLALIQKARPTLNFIKDSAFKIPNQVRANSTNFISLPHLTLEEIKETLNSLTSEKIPVAIEPKFNLKRISLIEKKAHAKPKIKRQYKKINNKYFIFTGLIILWIIITPFVALFISGLSLKKAYSDISGGQTGSVNTYFSVSKRANSIAKFGFGMMAKVPLVGSSFKFFLDTTRIIAEANDIGIKGLEAENIGREIATGALGSGDYDLTGLSGQMSLTLNDLYEELSLFQTEIDSYPTSILRIIPESVDIKKTRSTIQAVASIFDDLPSLLGVTKPQTYLVLFQNNMELRPTGGFIGSFGLFTFDKGRLIDDSIFDVYTADGQLKGHVEPPAAIKNYLGEANWFLRDSNWDPDFPTSATKAEWFLGKELDRPVDGVVGVDLEVVKSLLKLTGPVTLKDFNSMEINEKNMYQKIQYEVQNNFFPGSQKKANILTSLSNAISEKIMSPKSGDDYIKFGKAVLTNLQEKDIEIFLHDKSAQNSISKANWDGAVEVPTCSLANCQGIWLGMVDANVGVNKVNYFLKRSTSLSVNIAADKISENLEITYTNNAPISLGLNGNYKNYLRVLAPIDASFRSQADIVDIAGHKEAGVLVEVPAGTSKKVMISWETPVKADFGKKGTLLLNWRKQPGTGADPINVRFTTNILSLTKAKLFGYNTDLSTDFTQTINW